MKKTYTKPEIMFEDFSLSTSIALGCVYGAQHQQYMCPYVDNEFFEAVIFLESMGNVCETQVEDSANNGLCYHDPVPELKIFAS